MESRAGFDPERYLRRLGERLLVGGQDPRGGHPFGDSPISEAARALVAVGAIDPDRGQAIADEYDQATTIRAPDGPYHHMMRMARRPPATTPGAASVQRRVRACRGVVEQATGSIEVSYVQLASDSVELGVRIRLTQPRRRGQAMLGPRMPTAVTVADDQGTSVSCSFNGGGGDGEMRGRLVSGSPLSLDTDWLELDGTRLWLGDQRPAHAITIEPLTDGSPAHRYLWHRLANDSRWHRSNTDIGRLVTLLVDADAIAAGDPVLDAVDFIAERRPGPGPGGHFGGGAGGRRTEPAGVPERWHSLLRAPRPAAGPGRSLVVDAAVPAFDGYEVRVLELSVDEDGLSAEIVVVTPDRDHGDPPRIDQSTLAWWATDDLGNWYLGERGNWSSGGRSMQGTIAFRPQLDARATELALMPSTWRERAVIVIPLDWEVRAP